MTGRAPVDIEQPVREDARYWRTNVCHCDLDEETSWWGFWYPWLVQGRTSHLFEVGDSRTQIYIFIAAYFCLVCSAIASAIIHFWAGMLGVYMSLLVIVWKRASIRKSIRRKLNIYGSFANDLFLHCCCSPCTICQEAREGKLIHGVSNDLCSGELLKEQEMTYARNTGHGRKGTIDNPADGDIFLNHLRSISKTGKLILYMSAFLTIVVFIRMVLAGNAQNIFILLFAFVQPSLILYFVYWRARRQHTSLDLVIKCFAVGFFVTTNQSMIFEVLSQVVLILVVMMFTNLIKIPPLFAPKPIESGAETIASLIQIVETEAKSVATFQHRISAALNNVFSMHNSLYSSSGGIPFGLSPTPGVSLIARYQYQLIDQQKHSLHLTGMEKGSEASTKYLNEILRPVMQQNILLVLFVLFLVAFVTAAGVEETMKHFIVRCCPFNKPLKDPHSIAVYLVSGALGFATYENIQYAFSSSIPGTSPVVGGLITLLVRCCLPIHIICAVLQSINLSKVVSGKKDMSLIRIIFPAILLHGTFDFVLFVMGIATFAYDIQDPTPMICTYIFIVALTLAAAIYAYRSFKEVEKEYETGYAVTAAEETDLMS